MSGDALARRRSLPPGGGAAMLAMADGWPVRAMCWPGRDPGPGSILLINGRADFIEKYAETIHDLTAGGWGVAAFDWRGQGRSGRLGDDRFKGHATSFDPWLDDLATIAGWFAATLPGPRFAIAHSMGAHLLVRHLEGGGGGFDRAVLLSPMLGLRAAPLGAWAARLAARLAVGLGQGGRFVVGGGARLARVAGSPRQRLLTRDAERYDDEGWWIAREPGLELGAVTWGWLAAAFASLDRLFAPGALERLTMSLLILAADGDGLVDNDGAMAAAKRLPDVGIEIIAGAGHELLREVPAVRAGVLARVTGFFGTAT